MASLMEKAKHFLGEKAAAMRKPEASISNVDLGDVSRDCIIYNAKVDVLNPYGHSLPICEITYTLKSNGRIISKGEIPDPGSLAPKEKTKLNVALKVPHGALVSLVKDIVADWDIDYGLDIGLIVDLPLLGNFTIPLSTSGQIRLPTLSDLF